MQKSHLTSLNAIRVFAAVARHSSIKIAAAKLGVTPSAASHQIKKLEASIGVTLLERGNNSISLTDAGQRLFAEADPAIATIERAVGDLQRGDDEIGIRVGVSLAVRWLIPALERFKSRHPNALLRIDTTHFTEVRLEHGADVAISHCGADRHPTGGLHLCTTFFRPMLSPGLFKRIVKRDTPNIAAIPAISHTSNRSEWRDWCAVTGIDADDISIDHEVDTEDAAIHAAVAGFGVVLASTLMTRREVEAGTLLPLPGFEPVPLGGYYLLRGSRDDRMVNRFTDWLRSEMSACTDL